MKSILIVDDFKSLRDYLCIVLVEEGYSVFEAEGPKEAIKILQTTPIDLIITDVIMPDKDGIELLIYLRAHFPTIKTLAISGSTHADIYLASAKKIGANATLTKPFDHETLMGIVQDLLNETKPIATT